MYVGLLLLLFVVLCMSLEFAMFALLCFMVVLLYACACLHAGAFFLVILCRVLVVWVVVFVVLVFVCLFCAVGWGLTCSLLLCVCFVCLCVLAVLFSVVV